MLLSLSLSDLVNPRSVAYIYGAMSILCVGLDANLFRFVYLPVLPLNLIPFFYK